LKVKREALVTDKHEAAIFGPKEGISVNTLALDREVSPEKDPKIATPSANSVLSEQVLSSTIGYSFLLFFCPNFSATNVTLLRDVIRDRS
jgi:hypothetical protein